MPGHKRNTENFAILEKLGSKYDITEIDGFDNLHNAENHVLPHPHKRIKPAYQNSVYQSLQKNTHKILT